MRTRRQGATSVILAHTFLHCSSAVIVNVSLPTAAPVPTLAMPEMDASPVDQHGSPLEDDCWTTSHVRFMARAL